MRKFIVGIAAVAAIIGTAYAVRPIEFAEYAETAKHLAMTLRGSVESNPVPVFIALGTFLVTVGYHKAKGKSFRESVEAAATRVTLVPVPAGRRARTPWSREPGPGRRGRSCSPTRC